MANDFLGGARYTYEYEQNNPAESKGQMDRKGYLYQGKGDWGNLTVPGPKGGGGEKLKDKKGEKMAALISGVTTVAVASMQAKALGQLTDKRAQQHALEKQMENAQNRQQRKAGAIHMLLSNTPRGY